VKERIREQLDEMREGGGGIEYSTRRAILWACRTFLGGLNKRKGREK